VCVCLANVHYLFQLFESNDNRQQQLNTKHY